MIGDIHFIHDMNFGIVEVLAKKPPNKIIGRLAILENASAAPVSLKLVLITYA